MRATRGILYNFNGFTRMKVNCNKSVVMCLQAYTLELQSNLEQTIKIRAKDFLIKYLGLSIIYGKLKHKESMA